MTVKERPHSRRGWPTIVLYACLSFILSIQVKNPWGELHTFQAQIARLAVNNVAASDTGTSTTTRRQLDPEEDDNIITIVQIGANDGSSKGNDDEVLRQLLLLNATQALLLEANPTIFPNLQDNIPKLYPNNAKIHAVQALIGEEGGADFWAVNASKLHQDFRGSPLPHWLLYQLGSLDRDTVERNAQSFIRTLNTTRPTSDYLYSMFLPSHSLRTILQKYSIAPQSVNVLALDTEGHDAAILTQALAIPRFLPARIIFEQKTVYQQDPSALDSVKELLTSRGYTLDCNRDAVRKARHGCPIKLDAIAIHSQLQDRITRALA